MVFGENLGLGGELAERDDLWGARFEWGLPLVNSLGEEMKARIISFGKGYLHLEHSILKTGRNFDP